MFGDVAKQLLHLMGQGENVPGVIESKDIPTALANLERHLSRLPAQPEEDPDVDEDDIDYEPPIGLGTRAIPLIAMLKEAQQQDCFVMYSSE